MKLVFFYADLKEREIKLFEALKQGAALYGDEVEGVPSHMYGIRKDADVVSMFGVKGSSSAMLREYSKLGIHTLYIDKGYTRCCPKGRPYYKLVLNGFNRDDLGTLNCRDDRLKKLGGDIKKYRQSKDNTPIVIAGSSAKFHEFAGLTNPLDYTTKLYKALRKKTTHPIIYRPKPSYKDAVEIEGMRFSRPPETLQDLFTKGVHALITYGSNAGVDAMFAGVPVVSLTDLCVTSNISSTTIDEINEPFVPDNKQRYQWLSDLTYQQWTIEEMASGEAWGHIRKDIKP